MLMVMLVSSVMSVRRWNDFRLSTAVLMVILQLHQLFQFSPVVMLVVSSVGIGVFQDPLGLLFGLFGPRGAGRVWLQEIGKRLRRHFYPIGITDGLRSL